MDDIKRMDLYQLLSVSVDCTDQEIKKSFRRLALSCHPDKNPDNPSAIERFHLLSKALEILTDATARTAYDKLLSARKANILRHKKLDQKRQKLKDDLEAREKVAKDDVMTEAEAEKRLNREIERLRKEGSKQLETENEILKQKIQSDISSRVEDTLRQTESLPKIKVIKKSKKFEFSEDSLKQFFKDYGKINCLVLTKNNKRALIEFSKTSEALNVFQSRDRLQDLFGIEWLGDRPPVVGEDCQLRGDRSANVWDESQSTVEKRCFTSDYENEVLTSLGMAAQRQRTQS